MSLKSKMNIKVYIYCIIVSHVVAFMLAVLHTKFLYHPQISNEMSMHEILRLKYNETGADISAYGGFLLSLISIVIVNRIKHRESKF